LAENFALLHEPSWVPQVVDIFQPITAPYFPQIIKARTFAKRQCERQWLTPPGDWTTIGHPELKLKHSTNDLVERLWLCDRPFICSLYMFCHDVTSGQRSTGARGPQLWAML